MDEAAFVPEEEEEDQPPPTQKKEVHKVKSSQGMSKKEKLEQFHQQLKEAIEKEDYEKAARLRDEIRKLEMSD
jgi:protein-arginine kinase activator protein McsA